ncbi:hypothetical protein MPER_12460 [Moniliophthora perniciosa FA553]|nr:hypothetical protein MPER_12460 [Moniliophthora perniciosa FA553]
MSSAARLLSLPHGRNELTQLADRARTQSTNLPDASVPQPAGGVQIIDETQSTIARCTRDVDEEEEKGFWRRAMDLVVRQVTGQKKIQGKAAACTKPSAKAPVKAPVKAPAKAPPKAPARKLATTEKTAAVKKPVAKKPAKAAVKKPAKKVAVKKPRKSVNSRPKKLEYANISIFEM